MDIKGVINKHGYSVNSLAKKMDVWQSALNQVTNGQNPTIGKLKEVAKGLECSWLEFFADEITVEDLMSAFPEQMKSLGASQQPAPQPSVQPSAPAAPQTEGELPTNPAIFRCPHCGAGVVMEVLVVQPPIYKPEDVQEQPSAESSDGEKQSDELPFKDGGQ